MKKVYLITLFNAKTNKYFATYNAVYETKELAEKQLKYFRNPSIKFTIICVDMYNDERYIS